MKIDGTAFRTIWTEEDSRTVRIIDQTRLPHAFEIIDLTTPGDAARAISDMLVRGAPLIGATAAYGIAMAMAHEPSDAEINRVAELLLATRPTAINLRWAVDVMQACLEPLDPDERADAAYARAAKIADDDVEMCRRIGLGGLPLIEQVAAAKDGAPVNILTHCNAGWLATVDWGTATAPIYMAHDAGTPVHVWVDETRPRNQGASLTAFELGQHGVPHTVIADNVGGHLMQDGQVDLVIVGTDRTTSTGDVCNKIGTYLKALAAHDNQVPFYVALPGPTIDWALADGRDIPIEERDGDEVSHMTGLTRAGKTETVEIVAPGSAVANYGFDITPARLVTGLITERGLTEASATGLKSLYPECAP